MKFEQIISVFPDIADRETRARKYERKPLYYIKLYTNIGLEKVLKFVHSFFVSDKRKPIPVEEKRVLYTLTNDTKTISELKRDDVIAWLRQLLNKEKIKANVLHSLEDIVNVYLEYTDESDYTIEDLQACLDALPIRSSP